MNVRAAGKTTATMLGAILALFAAGARAQGPGQLTVKRIYSQPSLSGRLYRGVAWSSDSRLVSFLETKGLGKDAKSELWAVDRATGERRLLVGAERLESILSADKSQPTQATGLGRRPAAQYAWSPAGNSVLFI